MRFAVLVVVLGALAISACAGREDVTPSIVVSPNAKGRIAVMDRFRHHGDVRRWLPRVTVEEVDDDAGLPEGEEDAEGAHADDGGGTADR